MGDPRKMMADLLRRACDPGASENERAASFSAMAKCASKLKHDDVHAIADGIEGKGAAPSGSGGREGFRSALEKELVIAGVREAQKRDDQHAVHAVSIDLYDAAFELPIELRCSEVGDGIFAILSHSSDMHRQALGDPSVGSRKETLKDVVNELGRVLMERRVIRSSDRRDKLYERVLELVSASGELPGINLIAKMVGARAADVRREIKNLIAYGCVLAVGSGRSRRYRWIPPEERPDYDG